MAAEISTYLCSLAKQPRCNKLAFLWFSFTPNQQFLLL